MLTCAERAQQILPRDSANYFDLEYPPHAQRLEQATQLNVEAESANVIAEVPGSVAVDAALALPLYLRDKVAQTMAERAALKADAAAASSAAPAALGVAP